VQIRPARAEDARYIISSWTKAAESHHKSALYAAADRTQAGRIDRFLPRMGPVVARILSKASVLVAVDDAGAILGFCAFDTLIRPHSADTPVLYWVQVRAPAQRQGVATALLKEAGFALDRSATYAFGTTLYPQLKSKLTQWAYVPHWML
jgi:GNAT superfamily N-acetyltransferase